MYAFPDIRASSPQVTVRYKSFTISCLGQEPELLETVDPGTSWELSHHPLDQSPPNFDLGAMRRFIYPDYQVRDSAVFAPCFAIDGLDSGLSMNVYHMLCIPSGVHPLNWLLFQVGSISGIGKRGEGVLGEPACKHLHGCLLSFACFHMQMVDRFADSCLVAGSFQNNCQRMFFSDSSSCTMWAKCNMPEGGVGIDWEFTTVSNCCDVIDVTTKDDQGNSQLFITCVPCS